MKKLKHLVDRFVDAVKELLSPARPLVPVPVAPKSPR